MQGPADKALKAKASFDNAFADLKYNGKAGDVPILINPVFLDSGTMVLNVMVGQTSITVSSDTAAVLIAQFTRIFGM